MVLCSAYCAKRGCAVKQNPYWPAALLWLLIGWAVSGAEAAELESITVEANGMSFNALAAGPEQGPLVILLHGFPETSYSWRKQLRYLGALGYRAVAPDQRGYSPGARPLAAADYRMELLVSDVFAIATALGHQRFGLVGHGWGGAVAWVAASVGAHRIRSLTVLSTPHYETLASSRTDPNGTPRGRPSHFDRYAKANAERVLLANGAEQLRRIYANHPEPVRQRYIERFSEPAALRAALNWYRAAFGSGGGGDRQPFGPVSDRPPVQINVPTLYLWGTQDSVFTEAAAEATKAYVGADYEFVRLPRAGHWLTEQASDAVSSALVNHLIGASYSTENSGFKTVSFPSEDGLEITADYYPGAYPAAPVVLLFHQAGSSRGEFRKLAWRLQELGYHALAVDLRWGNSASGIVNETARRNKTPELIKRVEAGVASPWPTIYASYPDMLAALTWADQEGLNGPRYALGSAYSAMLALRMGAEQSLAGVIAYSPGEYDNAAPKQARAWAKQIKVPVFNVAGPGEEQLVTPIADASKAEGSQFMIAASGRHGASIIYADDENWQSLAGFLGHHSGGPPRREEVLIDLPNGESLFADRYSGSGERGVALLFHQGGGSARGEYGFLVARLLGMGFDVMAPDLHGGGDRFGLPNRTVVRYPTAPSFRYCDAGTEMTAVAAAARRWRPDQPMTLWGSSYSATLALREAVASAPNVVRVLAFSPAGGPALSECSLDQQSQPLPVPVLVVRPKSEMDVAEIAERTLTLSAVGAQTFVANPGLHGSSTLNAVRLGGQVAVAWDGIEKFLLSR